jgi:hypothetical protein
VSESDNFQKHALESIRLAADCMQLAADVHSPTLQRHFLRMAKVWTAGAERGPGADNARQIQLNGLTQPTHGLRDSRP